MIGWLRGHGYACADTLVRLARAPASALFNILVVGIALALPLIGFTLLASLQPLTGQLTGEAEISVFLTLDTSREQAQTLGPRLRALPGVLEARLVTREEALTRLKAQAGMAEVLAALDANPLPDAWVLRLSAASGASAKEALARDLARLPRVERVALDTEWLRRMEALLRLVRTGLLLFASALGLAVVAVVFNTIRLQVATQREEIAVARLIGATRGFIRRPFYYLGAIQGLAGGALAVGLVAAALLPLNQAVIDLARLYGARFSFAPLDSGQLALFLAAATLLGWLGAALSVGRYLRERG